MAETHLTIDSLQLDAFLGALPWSDFTVVARPYFDNDAQLAGSFLRTLQAEAHLGLRLIQPELRPGMRVLEVGAGMGLLSSFLTSRGVEVTALEPGLGGFGVSASLASAMADLGGFPNPNRLAIPAERLQGGPFDLIFSVNVLEHIPMLAEAIRGMARVLGPDGRMVHTCPNYLIPYEPHFAIPLVPAWPRLTHWIVPAIRHSELWQSLNFVTLPQIRRIAATERLEISFEQGVLYRAFERIESDPAFRDRQGNGIVKWAYACLRLTGTLGVLRHLPAVLATPMVFRLAHAKPPIAG